MLKRMSTLFLALVFVTSASASTVGPQAVQNVIQEFNYSISVEWDQKDPAFYKAQVEKLKSELAALQADGVPMSDIIAASVSSIKDAKLAADMKAALEVVQAGKLSIEEAQSMVFEAARNSNTRGASWSSDVFMYIGPIIGIALVLALLAGGSSGDGTTDGGTNPGPGYNCGYNWVYYWGYDTWGYYGYQSDFVYTCGYGY